MTDGEKVQTAGPLVLHGGGEYVRGDEPAMDALVAAAVEAAAIDPATHGDVGAPRIVIVPTAAARQRPDLAASHGERAFAAAAARSGVAVDIGMARVLSPGDASDRAACAQLERAHLVHFPGGDPDLIPTLLGGSPAWAALIRAHARGAVIAGASAGAMALAEVCWTPGGPIPGLGLLPGYAVLPHFDPGRLERWRGAVERDASSMAWLGLDEQTLVIGRPGEPWIVAGRGRAHVVAADGRGERSAGPGELIGIG